MFIVTELLDDWEDKKSMGEWWTLAGRNAPMCTGVIGSISPTQSIINKGLGFEIQNRNIRAYQSLSYCNDFQFSILHIKLIYCTVKHSLYVDITWYRSSYPSYYLVHRPGIV